MTICVVIRPCDDLPFLVVNFGALLLTHGLRLLCGPLIDHRSWVTERYWTADPRPVLSYIFLDLIRFWLGVRMGAGVNHTKMCRST